MKCDNCGDSDASIHQIHVSDSEIKHVQLCESCAEDQPVKEAGGGQTVGEFFSDLQDHAGEEIDDQCPQCGLSLQELRNTNKVGCAECYSVFRDQFESIVHRIHGADQHIGEREAPSEAESFGDTDSGGENTGLGKVSREQKLQLLNKRLQKRVDEEDYEAAADLRDRIQELKDGTDNEFTD